MSNEELPLSAEVASAYLDGELDATERAAASADPEVMAEVESFARVRAALGEIDPVVASTKTAAIAAALAEFDAIHAAPSSPIASPTAGEATDVAAATNVVSLQSRRMRSYRVLSRVAAVVVVGAVVVTALNASRSDDKDSASSATEVPAAAELPLTKAAGATEAATEAEAAPAATDAPAATMAAAADAGAAADSAAAEIPVIDTVEALQQFAAGVESAPTTTVSSQPLNAESPPQYGNPAPGGYAPASCLDSDQVVLGSIVFQGTPAFAVRDSETGDLQAVDVGDCHVLVAVEVP
jgi:hypothetical protein